MNKSNVQLFEKLGKTETVATSNDGVIVIPVSNRRYLKVANTTCAQLVKAFANATIID